MKCNKDSVNNSNNKLNNKKTVNNAPEIKLPKLNKKNEINKLDMSKYILIDKVPKCPKTQDLSEYMHKKDLPDMSKYIRKDKIPCWGCNLK